MEEVLKQEKRRAKKADDNRRGYERRKLAAETSPSAEPLACKRPPTSSSKDVIQQIQQSEKMLNPGLLAVFQIGFSISVTSLLAYFQAESYIQQGMGKALSYMVSAICELALCYLSAGLKTSYFIFSLWAAIFSYNVLTMSYPLIKTHVDRVSEISIQATLTRDFEDEMKTRKDREDEIFSSAKISFDIATQAGKLTLAQKMLSTMQEVGQKNTLPKLTEIPKGNKNLQTFQTVGLICLRALLMILNAVLIHRIFNERGKNETRRS